MCAHNLRDSKGQLLKKPTGWLSNLPFVLDQMAKQCAGDHPHGQCLGSSETKRAQVYTPELAKAVVKGVKHALAEFGDERFVCQAEHQQLSWVADADYDDSPSTTTMGLPGNLLETSRCATRCSWM